MLVFAVRLPPDQTGSGMVVVQDTAHQMPLGVLQYQERQRQVEGVGSVPGSIHIPQHLEGAQCLEKHLDVANCYALNEAFGFPWSNLLVDDNAIGLKSNVDDQLVLQLAFGVPVKVRNRREHFL